MHRKYARPPRGPHQLPPGRHGLSRSFVARNQRERLLAAVAEATTELGYAHTSVEIVVRRAGVSRRTFYEHFRNKEDVFLQAFDRVARLLVAAVRAAYEQQPTFEARVVAGFRAFLETLAASRAFAHMCIVEALAAGPGAVAKRAAVMAEFTQLIRENAESLLATDQAAVPAMHAETIVAGAYEKVYQLIAAGRTEALPGLLPDLVESALLPYVGETDAQAWSRSAADGGGDVRAPYVAPID